uniref:Fibronectin type-III domain-containing protein n=1 Tax=Marseillevirus LCMAC201 TaxID=2506605 RepID=A0A481YXW6_9VIRU|nr:MAG: hypothetical protein LCMAC201_02940 [Marseillevirus LCMAC201]
MVVGFIASDPGLSKPTNIKVVANINSVKITWNPTSGADHYIVKVYLASDDHNGENNSTFLMTVRKPEVDIDIGLHSETEYRVSVTAKQGGNGNLHSDSTFATFITKSLPLTPPDPCTGCSNNNDCTGCLDNAVCISEHCKACDSDSECYNNRQVCIDAECQNCSGDSACQHGYGDEYVCDKATTVAMCIAETPSQGLILLLTFGMIGIICIVGFLLFMFNRNKNMKID